MHEPHPEGGDLRSAPQRVDDATPRNTILVGDALTRLRQLPPVRIDTAITSPPYFAQRDYGTPGQLGAGGGVGSWVTELRSVCAELARVLAPHGSLWLNLGDGYSPHARYGAHRKSLLCGPERLLLQLVSDGWIVRNKVIWAKTNPMPSSIRDRLTCTYEVVYLLVRSEHYYFDLDVIRQPLISPARQFRGNSRSYPPRSAVPSTRADWTKSDNRGLIGLTRAGHPLGKNPGDVWRLPTAGFRGSHFATFPERLVERPLLATTPERACSACGQPWRRGRPDELEGRAVIGQMRPICPCNAGYRKGLALDPFFGSGTVGLVAERHDRDWLGIELNPDYADLARKRIETARQAAQPPTYTRCRPALAA
jgi:site-specific DNA-methyltransferase (adenine-specific)